LAAVPAERFSLSNLSFSVSTVSLFKYVFEHHVLLRIREEFADPDDLLKPLIFADLKNDLFGASKLAGRKPITPVNKKRNIVVPSSVGRGWNLVNGTPRKPKGSRFVQCVSREAQEANTYES
jgi:hypothetical protein